MASIWRWLFGAPKIPVEEPKKRSAPSYLNGDRLKAVVIGQGGVGKTSMIRQLVTKEFIERDCTISASFYTKDIVTDEYEYWKIKLELWDTAGPERFHSLAPMYYRGAAIVVIVYDITDQYSFRQVPNYFKELDRMEYENIVILVGNKDDLVRNREVSEEQGLEIAEKHKALFMECTAKKYESVEAVYKEAVTAVQMLKSTQLLNIFHGRVTKKQLRHDLRIGLAKCRTQRCYCDIEVYYSETFIRS
jgi:small GTP-binding protein